MGPSLTALPLFVALFLGFASMTQSDDSQDCKDNTLNFTPLNDGTSEDYDERKYDPSVWICTAVKGITVKIAAIAANYRLKDFREKATYSDEKMKCDTWPVLISAKVISKEDYEYEMCWLVPPKAKVSLLKPSNGVEVKEVSEVTVFVRKFGGSPSFEEGLKNKKILEDALTKAEESFNNTIYYGAGYDPYISYKHHNEIWIPKNNK